MWRRSQAATETNEWSAAFDVEAYFRDKPFVYDLDPKFSDKSPVLAQFMLTGYHGYCQMFSGAMALVLRLHGIPARVPVGFTTGVKGPGVTDPYVVTDRDAHSWVEAYFPGLRMAAVRAHPQPAPARRSVQLQREVSGSLCRRRGRPAPVGSDSRLCRRPGS